MKQYFLIGLLTISSSAFGGNEQGGFILQDRMRSDVPDCPQGVLSREDLDQMIRDAMRSASAPEDRLELRVRDEAAAFHPPCDAACFDLWYPDADEME
jgi:hypothetical protein